jgi:hypothetical protein
VARDDEGADFASIEEAFLEAFEGAQELWHEFLRNRDDPRRYAYEITDRHAVVLMELPFVEILESCHPIGPMSVSGSRKQPSAVMTKRAFLRAVENAHKLNTQSAELAATLRTAWKSINELKESTRASLTGLVNTK